MSRILFLGDVHGHWPFATRLLDAIDKHDLHYDEIIQVGDMGFWPGTIGPWLRDPGCRARWVDGNHEHFPRLHARGEGFGVSEHTPWIPEWEAFLERWEYQPRGTITDGILFVGGARSIDKHYRTEGVSWFAEESLSEADRAHIVAQVEAYGPENIHTVVSHDCPQRFDVLAVVIARYGGAKLGADPNRPFLDELFELVRPERWLFGHYHVRWSEVVDGCHARCISLVEDMDFEILDIPTSEEDPK